jgi:hypothetical protein
VQARILYGTYYGTFATSLALVGLGVMNSPVLHSYLTLLFIAASVVVPALAVLVDNTDPRIHYTPASRWSFYTFQTAADFWVNDPRVYNRTL